MWFCVCKMMKCYLKTPTIQRAPLKRSINRGWVWVQPGGESVTPPFWPPVSLLQVGWQLQSWRLWRKPGAQLPASLPPGTSTSSCPSPGFIQHPWGWFLSWSRDEAPLVPQKPASSLSSPRIGPESKSTPGRGIVLRGRSAWSWWVVMLSPCPIWTHGKH